MCEHTSKGGQLVRISSNLQMHPSFGIAVSIGGMYSTDQLGYVFTEGLFIAERLGSNSVIHQLGSLITKETIHRCEKNEDMYALYSMGILEKKPKSCIVLFGKQNA